MNPSTIARLEQVHPTLKAKAYQLIEQLAQQGIHVEVSQGLRTWAEQEALYAQGRTIPGRIVTRARPEQSWHTFGCAFDIAVFDPGGGIDWSGTSAAWDTTVRAGIALGLVSGSEFRTFPDLPHFQYTGRFPVTPNEEVLSLYQSGGLQAVWDEVTGHTTTSDLATGDL